MARLRDLLVRHPFIFAAISAVVVGACSFLAWSFLQSRSRDDDWMANFKPTLYAASFAVSGSDFEIENSRIATHPFLAEYDRIVTYIKNGERGANHPLDFDPGGGYPIYCYLLEENGKKYVYLRDRISKHLLDLENQVTYVIKEWGDSEELIDSGFLVKVDPTALSMGDVPTINFPIWGPKEGFIPMMVPMQADADLQENPGPFAIASPLDQVEAIPLKNVVPTTEGEYLGRFDGRGGVFRFVPASEEPEVKTAEPSPVIVE
jgi:hypothetical protein